MHQGVSARHRARVFQDTRSHTFGVLVQPCIDPAIEWAVAVKGGVLMLPIGRFKVGEDRQSDPRTFAPFAIDEQFGGEWSISACRVIVQCDVLMRMVGEISLAAQYLTSMTEIQTVFPIEMRAAEDQLQCIVGE
jgi:hypothetical protein